MKPMTKTQKSVWEAFRKAYERWCWGIEGFEPTEKETRNYLRSWNRAKRELGKKEAVVRFERWMARLRKSKTDRFYMTSDVTPDGECY